MAEHEKIDEDVGSRSLGKDLYMRNLRNVLIKKGYSGAALEHRINVVLARDPSRLASVLAAKIKK